MFLLMAAAFCAAVPNAFADREENWIDTYHHKAPTRAKEAEQVAASVLAH